MTPTARTAYLKQLVDEGYGETPSDVTNYLIDRELDDLLRSKVLTPVSQTRKR